MVTPYSGGHGEDSPTPTSVEAQDEYRQLGFEVTEPSADEAKWRADEGTAPAEPERSAGQRPRG